MTHSDQELKAALAALRESKERLVAAHRIARLGDFTWNVDTGEVTWSETLYELLGYDPSKAVNLDFVNRSVHHPDDLPNVEAWLMRCIDSGEMTLTPFEYRVVRKNGEVIYVRTVGIIEQHPDAGTVVFATTQDITERKRAELALMESEERYRRIIEDQTEFIVRWRPDGTRTFVNESYCRYYGLKREQAIGSSFFPLIKEEDRERIKRRIEHLTVSDPVSTDEHRVIRPDGSIGWNRWTDRAIFDKDGRLIEYQSVGHDITERKEAQESLERALNEIRKLKERLEAENVYLREEVRMARRYGDIVTESDEMKAVVAQVQQVAPTQSTVILLGETGTGKELLARATHDMSARKGKPLVIVNCAAMATNLVESELFGHEKGAFTGALSRRIGRFEAADGGTLFLDEIGELNAAVQAKLLRILQEGRFERVGGTRTVSVNVRIITATNRNLEEMVADGTFREDLYYRLNVFPIIIPPLRSRREEIPALVWSFVREFNEKMNKNVEQISQASMDSLARYNWPGNIRELRNVVERAMILATGRTLTIPAPRTSAAAGSEAKALADVEREHIISVLRDVGWRVRGRGGAAEILAMNPSTLESRMKKLRIERPR